MAWSEPLAAQYNAATTGVGLSSLAEWSTLAVRGRDRAAFLHNMCTGDIRNLPAGGECEAFFTDVKGKIVTHAFVFALPDELLVVGAAGQAATLAVHLDRYIIREDVQLEDASGATSWSLAVGPGAAAVCGGIGGEHPVRSTPGGVLAACRSIWPGGAWAANGAAVVFRDLHAVECGDAVWHALRIESGWPLFGVDFDNSHLPQEVGRNALAINFRKGCYLGQETIARIDALGHVNKQLATVRFGAAVPAGGELFSRGEVVGRISSASYSPRLDAWLALAMVKRGQNAAGDSLECANQTGEVVPTPAVTA
jgi:folate-binding protein YgfZ